MSIDYYFIQPNDVLMFRDARPFTAGVDYAARSIFPPTPQTMQGVIRSTALEARGVNWQRGWAERLGDPALLEQLGFTPSGDAAALGDVMIVGPQVARKKCSGEIVPLVPLPLDMTARSKERVELYAPAKAPVLSDAPEGWLPLAAYRTSQGSSPEKTSDAGWWLDAGGVNAWARGELPSGKSLFQESDLFEFEERTGLALDRTRRTYRAREEGSRQGLMYRARFVRLASGIGLLVGVTRGVLAEGGTLVLGGESRMAHYTRVDFKPHEFSIPAHGRVKLTLTTPAWFSGGWYPLDGFNSWLGEGAQLISVALGKAHAIGGWDVNRRQHKPLAQYVPTGSVFFFDRVTRLPAAFTETPQDALDHARIGFGGFIAGTWDYA